MDGSLGGDTHSELEQTMAALEAGPTSLQPSTALKTIDFWESRARSAADDALTPVADGLVVLRDLLSADRLDGASIGNALLELADATDVVAGGTDDARLSPTLERFATLLRTGGTALSGSDPAPTDLGRADAQR